MRLVVAPYSELSSKQVVLQTLIWQAVGLLLLVCHVLLVKDNIIFFPITIALVGWLFANAPLAGLLVYFQILIYQNLVIAIFSPDMEYLPTYASLLATNFAILVVMAAISFSRLMVPSWRLSHGRVIWTVCVAIGAASLYGALGAVIAGPTAAITYFREFTGIAFATLIGMDVGRIWGYRTIAIGFLVSSLLSIGIGIIEFLAPVDYYNAINAIDYMALKYANVPQDRPLHSAEDLVAVNTTTLFNLTGGQDSTLSFRFEGTMLHSVSYAYMLAAVALVALSVRQGRWLLLVVPLLLLIGVKGANLLFICCICLWLNWYLTGSITFLLISGIILAVGYIGFGIWIGISTDYHVVGFLGGVNGFMANPLGHGLGVGGNFSSGAAQGYQWKTFLKQGSADFALESAIGVLIYQMGIGACAILGIFAALIRYAPFGMMQGSKRIPQRRDIVFLVVGMIAVNGVFQEEAFSPYAAPLFTLLGGVVIANGYRKVAAAQGSYSRQGAPVTAI